VSSHTTVNELAVSIRGWGLVSTYLRCARAVRMERAEHNEIKAAVSMTLEVYSFPDSGWEDIFIFWPSLLLKEPSSKENNALIVPYFIDLFVPSILKYLSNTIEEHDQKLRGLLGRISVTINQPIASHTLSYRFPNPNPILTLYISGFINTTRSPFLPSS